MSVSVPGIGSVPVVWKPSDLTGPDSDGFVGRAGQRIRAIVHHRVVGTLESMTNNTFFPTTDDILRAGERRVSSHFGIGFWGSELRIVQYVALQNTAFCNGQTAADKAACDWQLWKDAGRPDANTMTVSIEHEDNANLIAGAKYVVRPEIIAASIELDRLMLSGDGDRIRAAGIRCTDEAAAQLGRIVPSVQTIVDHHVVAPVSKPFCWRAIGDDPGFPQARYVAALATNERMDMYLASQRPGTASIPKGAVVSGYDLSGAAPRKVKTWENHDASAFRFSLVASNMAGTSPSPVVKAEGGFFDGLWVPLSQVTETFDPPTSFTQADLDAARLAGKREGYDLAKAGVKISDPPPSLTWPARP